MADLAHSTSTLGGVAGQIKRDGNREFVYAYVAASVAKGQPTFLVFDGDEEYNPKTSAIATSTTVYNLVIFPTAAQGTTAGFQWCQYKGDAEVLCNGSTQDIAKDDYLECINATTSLITDGTSGATAKTTGSIAIAQEAYTPADAALVNVYLLGERVFTQAA